MQYAPGLIQFITATDTEILGLSAAVRRLPSDFPPTRAVHLRQLAENRDLDQYIAQTLPQVRVLVVRILGGRGYFQNGFDRLAKICRQNGVAFLPLPGGREPDPELMALSTVPLSALTTALEYLIHGGVDNYEQLLRFISDRFLLTGFGYEPAQPTPNQGIYEPAGLAEVNNDAPLVGILFYRAHWLAGNLLAIDALAEALHRCGCRSRVVFCDSLKDTDDTGMPLAVRDFLQDAEVVISTLSFGSRHGLDCPIIQAILCGSCYEEWQISEQGLAPRDVAMHVALPEFDGRIITVPVAFKNVQGRDPLLGAELRRDVPRADRIRQVAQQAAAWSKLRHTPVARRRVAILFNNYPTRNSRIGNGVGLDTPASVIQLLHALKESGYQIDDIPECGDALIAELLRGCTQDERFQQAELLEDAPLKLDLDQYRGYFQGIPAKCREEVVKQWQAPPGDHLLASGGMAVPGLCLGKVFIGVQPARGFGIDSRAVYHSPDLPPHHHYLAYYHWIRNTFQAHAVIHMGKHGNLEWLPGKGIGLSGSCYPEIILGDLPNLYPYIINNPGEGTQAKRRTHAVVVDHMIPVMTRAESYGDLVKLEHLADEYATVSALDPAKVPRVTQKMLEVIEQSRIYRDLAYDRPPSQEELDDFILAFDGYLCEIKESQIRDGLHILGQIPEGDRLLDLLAALVRLDQSGARGLPAAIASDMGIDYEALIAAPAQPVDHPECRTAGDLIELLEQHARAVIRDNVPIGPQSARTLNFLNTEVRPRVERTGEEISNLLRALDSRFVPPGPSGAPTRAMATILPTGRNFYSVDIRGIPSETAFEVGKTAAQSVLDRYLKETGGYPRSIGMVVWGTSNMRTGGDDIGEILHLLGVRPVWQGINRRVVGLDVVPLEELGRPRIDVVVRISGFFRDAFPNVVELLDDAIHTVAKLDEAPELNFVRANIAIEEHRGVDPAQAGYRIFGSKPGSYGAGLLALIDERNWKSDADLADVYITWGGYAYGRNKPGIQAFDEFRHRLSGINLALQNQDNREHDILDSDDYFQFHGGMIASVRSLSGANPKAYLGDTSKTDRIKVRDLKEELTRVFRARVVNPKWITSILRHGYRGASELTATIDYLFGYDATAQVIEPWMYEKLTAAYVLDDQVRSFLNDKNPWALRDMVERLLEAKDRGLWEEPPAEMIDTLKQILLENEAGLEETA